MRAALLGAGQHDPNAPRRQSDGSGPEVNPPNGKPHTSFGLTLYARRSGIALPRLQVEIYWVDVATHRIGDPAEPRSEISLLPSRVRS